VDAVGFRGKGGARGRASKKSGKAKNNSNSNNAAPANNSTSRGHRDTADSNFGRSTLPHTPGATCGYCRRDNHTTAQCRIKQNHEAQGKVALTADNIGGHVVSGNQPMWSGNANGW
jgi:hypothetical protein